MRCDFTVAFADGDTYSGRFDMKRNLAGEGSLEAHIQSELKFHAGLYCPSHLTRDKYEDLLRRLGSPPQDYIDFLAKYDLGADVPLLEAKRLPKSHLERAADLYRTLSQDERGLIRFGMYPYDAMTAVEAEGYDSHELVVALNEVADIAKRSEVRK
jgi:hypothetical protein